ncbi:MAG: hypothetical protein KC983_04785, partial [Phycisphaerales bacterium]|nr:hypothetical protein [Phycisphaerales bacterium]
LVVLVVVPGAMAQTGEITINLDQLGVGGVLRPGDMTGMRLSVESRRPDAVNVWVQWEVRNADGDIGEYGRTLTINPGSSTNSTRFWLYAPLSPNLRGDTTWTVGVYEMVDGVRGQRLAETLLSPPNPGSIAPADISLIAVLGTSRGNLDGLSLRGQQGAMPIASHEETRTAAGIGVAEAPDYWWGWSTYEAIYWGDAVAAPPTGLVDDRATALVDWIARGGHLIINLPASGNPWALGVPGPITRELERLLPGYERTKSGIRPAIPETREAIPLSRVLPQLAKSGYESALGDLVRQPVTMRVFRDSTTGFDVIDNHYQPLIATDAGEVFVIQRTYGRGQITVIGLDLSQPVLASNGLPQGDAFWNRILGRRADTPTRSEYDAIEAARMHVRGFNVTEYALGRGDAVVSAINQSQQAGVGLLLALVLFIVYWLVAGPGAYFALKSYKQSKHSWLAFALASIVFTGIAWAAVTVIPNRHLNIKHLTILDHIAQPSWDQRDTLEEPQMQTATSYISIYNPTYNDTVLTINSADPPQHDLLIPYSPPRSITQEFPNAARFRVDCAPGQDTPAELELPSRSTSTLVKARWRGNLTSEWGGLISEDPTDPVRTEEVIDPNTLQSRRVLRGTLLHDLPRDLEDVSIIWIDDRRQRTPGYLREGSTYAPWRKAIDSGAMLNVGHDTTESKWAPKTPLTLEFPDRSTLEQTLKNLSLQSANQYGLNMTGTVSESARRTMLAMLSFYHQLEPPSYHKTSATESDSGRESWFYRVDGRELDLSVWFNRPCLIVIGYLRNTEIPIPLRIGDSDEVPDGTGVTMVRWILPLKLDEGTMPSSLPSASDASPESSAGGDAGGRVNPMISTATLTAE